MCKEVEAEVRAAGLYLKCTVEVGAAGVCVKKLV